GREREFRESIQRGWIPDAVAVRRAFVSDGDDRQGRRGPVHLRRARALLWRLHGDVRVVTAALPRAPILVDQSAHRLRLHVADYHDGRVLGTIVAVEEL